VYKLFDHARFPHPYSVFHDKERWLGGFGDELGFLNEEAPRMPKPAGEKRIFLLGNSAVRKAPDTTAPPLPALLESVFHRHGHSQVKVFNFGIEGGNCGQSLMLFVDRLVDLAPDLVILYDGAPDLCFPYHYDPRPGYPFNAYLVEIMHDVIGQGALADLEILKLEKERRELLRDRFQYASDTWKEALADAYVRFIEKFMIVAKAYGINVVHVLQPVYRKLYPTDEETIIAQQTTFLEFCYEMQERALAKIENLHPAFPDGRAYRFASFANLFQAIPVASFMDWIHLTAQGNHLASRRLFDLVHDMVMR